MGWGSPCRTRGSIHQKQPCTQLLSPQSAPGFCPAVLYFMCVSSPSQGFLGQLPRSPSSLCHPPSLPSLSIWTSSAASWQGHFSRKKGDKDGRHLDIFVILALICHLVYKTARVSVPRVSLIPARGFSVSQHRQHVSSLCVLRFTLMNVLFCPVHQQKPLASFLSWGEAGAIAQREDICLLRGQPGFDL